MNLDERGACQILESATDYLSGKSYIGDDGLYSMPRDIWHESITDAIRHLKECESIIRLLAGKETI